MICWNDDFVETMICQSDDLLKSFNAEKTISQKLIGWIKKPYHIRGVKKDIKQKDRKDYYLNKTVDRLELGRCGCGGGCGGVGAFDES